MNRIQIESRVHRIINDALAGRPTEDDLIELKANWPTDFRRAARRIAGQANAAAQQPIIWILGIDEGARRILSPTGVDPASWYAQLRSEFADAWAPDVRVLNVPRDAEVVVALIFDTDGAPFLVRADADRLEVPWRAATSIRSARRHELLSLLSDHIDHPEVDVLDASLTAQANRVVPPDRVVAHTFGVQMNVYVTPRTSKSTHFPLYRCEMSFQPDDALEPICIGAPSAKLYATGSDEEAQFVDRQVSLAAPGFVLFSASAQLPIIECPTAAGVVRCSLAVAGSRRPLVAESRVLPAPKRSTADYRWWLPE